MASGIGDPPAGFLLGHHVIKPGLQDISYRLAALRTDSGRQLARAIGSADPHGWWSAFAASYTELRASTIERARKQLGEKGRPGS